MEQLQTEGIQMEQDDNEIRIKLLSLAQEHFDGFVADAIELLSGQPTRGGLGVGSPTLVVNDASGGTWTETNCEQGVTHKWPDGNIDTYGPFVSYQCDGGPFDGVRLAIGDVTTEGKTGEIGGFVLGKSGGSKRPLTVFFAAKDFATTGERLSMIRGKNGTRKGFAPSEDLPPVYDAFSIDILGDRIPGKWNVKAVVVTDDDAGRQAMLRHTAIQAGLRGLI